VRRAISRIECPSRKCQRRITLSNAMPITPMSPAINQQGLAQTWVTSQWKNPSIPGQFSAEINTPANHLAEDVRPLSWSKVCEQGWSTARCYARIAHM